MSKIIQSYCYIYKVKYEDGSVYCEVYNNSVFFLKWDLDRFVAFVQTTFLNNVEHRAVSPQMLSYLFLMAFVTNWR